MHRRAAVVVACLLASIARGQQPMSKVMSISGTCTVVISPATEIPCTRKGGS